MVCKTLFNLVSASSPESCFNVDTHIPIICPFLLHDPSATTVSYPTQSATTVPLLTPTNHLVSLLFYEHASGSEFSFCIPSAWSIFSFWRVKGLVPFMAFQHFIQMSPHWSFSWLPYLKLQAMPPQHTPPLPCLVFPPLHFSPSVTLYSLFIYLFSVYLALKNTGCVKA